MKQDNPFAKLGALEQKLYQETSSQQVDTKSQKSGNPENKKTSLPVSQKTSIPEVKISGNQENHIPRNLQSRRASPTPSAETDSSYRQFPVLSLAS